MTDVSPLLGRKVHRLKYSEAESQPHIVVPQILDHRHSQVTMIGDESRYQVGPEAGLIASTL